MAVFALEITNVSKSFLKNFLCLEIAEIGKGGQFCVEENNTGHKNSFLLRESSPKKHVDPRCKIW